DTVPCTPDVNGGCSGSPPLKIDVKVGDHVQTKLEPLHDPNPTAPIRQYSLETINNDILWNPIITYTSTTVGGPVTPPYLSEPNGPAIYQFDQAADFRLAGQPGLSWVANSDGRVKITGDITKNTTSDEVKV